MAEFSDYIVYVDESGDHSLTSIDPQFPVFALSFCVVRKDAYMAQIVPAMQALKFRYWGHDAVILHEHEIRKSKGDFTWLLTDRERRDAFYEDLNQIMMEAPISLIGSVIDKNAHIAECSLPQNPYEVALRFCLERLQRFLIRNEQNGKRIHVVFECRGKAEDDALRLAFHRIVSDEIHSGDRAHPLGLMEFEPKFARKAVNSTGLQLADLTARPLALRALRPDQANRTYDTISTKLADMKLFP